MDNIPTKDELKTFFDSYDDLFKLPICLGCDCEMYSALNNKWNAFLDIAQKTAWLQGIIPYISESISKVNAAISQFYNGNIVNAIGAISQLVELAEEMSQDTYAITTLRDFYEDSEFEWNEWYRARSSDLFSLKREDMLHIPFDKRAIIKNYRYSINGIPCLYLGNSIYICWEELRRPCLDSLCVSRFELKESRDLKIFNLSITENDLLSDNPNTKLFSYKKCVSTFFHLWVLQSACSVVIRKKNREFNAEYIVPQLLMQCLSSHGLDGISYFSTRADMAYSTSKSFICKNIAIPATDYVYLSNTKYSQKLENIFQWSSPINLGLYNIGMSQTRTDPWCKGRAMPHPARTNAQITVDNIYWTVYRESMFYRFENLLHCPNLYSKTSEM